VRVRAVLARLGARRATFSVAGRVVARGLMALAAVALGYAVLRLVERHMTTSASFAIERVDVTGNQQLTAAQVIEAAGLKLGDNLFKTSLEEAQARLAHAPWIEFASVRRRLPSRFSIEVRERRAVALLAAGPLQLVSDEGLAFKPLEPNDPVDLPVITGIDPNLHDHEAVSSALMSAVALMHDYQDSGLARREPIAEIHVERDGGMSLYVGGDTTYVRLGKAPFRHKLERLRDVLARLAKDKARAAYVYLDNQRRPDRVTARLR
jgi:cell division protein FtsQ